MIFIFKHSFDEINLTLYASNARLPHYSKRYLLTPISLHYDLVFMFSICMTTRLEECFPAVPQLS